MLNQAVNFRFSYVSGEVDMSFHIIFLSLINTFHTAGIYLYPLKIVSREYKKGPAEYNGVSENVF